MVRYGKCVHNRYLVVHETNGFSCRYIVYKDGKPYMQYSCNRDHDNGIMKTIIRSIYNKEKWFFVIQKARDFPCFFIVYVYISKYSET